MALFLQAVRLAKLPHCIPVPPRAQPHRQLFQNRPRPARTRHDGPQNQRRKSGYPGNLFRLGALRNHPLRSANGTFAEFARESCLNSHIMHVPFGQVRSRNLQPLSDAVIAVRYTRICLEKIAGALPVSDTSAERIRHMRIVPPRDHNNTWTCAPTWSPQGEPMRTGPEPTRSPAWNGWSARSPHAPHHQTAVRTVDCGDAAPRPRPWLSRSIVPS
jgi:hypothetical protein